MPPGEDESLRSQANACPVNGGYLKKYLAKQPTKIEE